MVEICEGTSATGDDAFHPGESVLTTGGSFQDLESSMNQKEKGKDDSDDSPNTDIVGNDDSDEVTCTNLHRDIQISFPTATF